MANVLFKRIYANIWKLLFFLFASRDSSIGTSKKKCGIWLPRTKSENRRCYTVLVTYDLVFTIYLFISLARWPKNFILIEERSMWCVTWTLGRNSTGWTSPRYWLEIHIFIGQERSIESVPQIHVFEGVIAEATWEVCHVWRPLFAQSQAVSPSFCKNAPIQAVKVSNSKATTGLKSILKTAPHK